MHILRCPPALKQARLPEHLRETISQHYRSAWLVCKHTSPAFTHTGSEPGIPLADLFFSVAFTRANNIVRADLTSFGLINKLSWFGERELGARQPRNYSTALMCNTSWYAHSRLQRGHSSLQRYLLDRAPTLFCFWFCC